MTNISKEDIAKAKILENCRKVIKSAISTKDIFRMLDNDLFDIKRVPLKYEEYFRPAFKRAIELSKTIHDAFDVFNDNDIKEPEKEIAIDKVLSFARDKEDVEEFLKEFIEYTWGITLDSEKYLLKFFKRGYELPHRLPEPNEEI
ncbi:hypothetical protein KAJ61_03800 [Candidatus Parcubacteria bacterium]|nr:hypothetical protein [Candidatus Parcubacteria bacterium]